MFNGIVWSSNSHNRSATRVPTSAMKLKYCIEYDTSPHWVGSVYRILGCGDCIQVSSLAIKSEGADQREINKEQERARTTEDREFQ